MGWVGFCRVSVGLARVFPGFLGFFSGSFGALSLRINNLLGSTCRKIFSRVTEGCERFGFGAVDLGSMAVLAYIIAVSYLVGHFAMGIGGLGSELRPGAR